MIIKLTTTQGDSIYINSDFIVAFNDNHGHTSIDIQGNKTSMYLGVKETAIEIQSIINSQYERYESR